MEQIWNENIERLVRFVFQMCILLSADVLEKFRNKGFNNYGLCPSYYLSTPALSWDTMLSMTKHGTQIYCRSSPWAGA